MEGTGGEWGRTGGVVGLVTVVVTEGQVAEGERKGVECNGDGVEVGPGRPRTLRQVAQEGTES